MLLLPGAVMVAKYTAVTALPEELLARIFKLLSSEEQVITLPAVCRKFHRVCR